MKRPKTCEGGCMAKHCAEKLESEKPREREAMRLTVPNMVLSVKQNRNGFVNRQGGFELQYTGQYICNVCTYKYVHV